MFVGRTAELNRLNEMYQSDKFECAIVYGRRRVGKTTLIREFVKDKDAIFFVAREASNVVNLNGFSSDVYLLTTPELAGNSFFSDWEKAFTYIYNIAKDNRIVLVIDEYPYLAAGYRSISSILQAHIDRYFKESKLFLILCGSSMSFMENQVLGYKSPLYGRRTAQFKILPFSFYESQPFFAGFSNEEKATLYGIYGGIPEYLSKIDNTKTMRENIIAAFLTPSGYFFEEPANLLKQELREPALYNSIISAIAQGASRLNEIATKCAIESNKCAKYLSALMTLGLVRKEHPVTETTSKKSIYLLEDMMFRFWYRFVFPNTSAIVAGLGNAVFEHEVEQNLSAYMGLIFEEICIQFLYEEAKRGKLPVFAGKIGKWWGNNPKLMKQEEIDILAIHRNSAIFAECKWTNALVDSDTLESLVAKADLFAYEKRWLWLFAKRGFSEKLIKLTSEDDSIRLISYEELLEVVELA